MWAEVETEVNDAVEENASFTDEGYLHDFLESLQDEATADGVTITATITYHDHDEMNTECSCSQFEDNISSVTYKPKTKGK